VSIGCKSLFSLAVTGADGLELLGMVASVPAVAYPCAPEMTHSREIKAIPDRFFSRS
jgi:hypothetical protein